MVWIAENLKTTKYNDGTAIPLVNDNSSWIILTSPAYCWYNNEIANKVIYGALYNSFTINTGKLCPAGWHVPSHGELANLESYLGVDVAAGELKDSTLWQSPNTGGTNGTGFTALPGGFRSNDDGSFYNIGYYGYWWTSFETIFYFMSYNSSKLGLDWADKKAGLSVRCLRD
jgi:Fibrobacter succinogenes major domain (Fib_succ_major).